MSSIEFLSRKFKLGEDTWIIRESLHSGLLVIYKNGKIYNCCAGSEYETESGACYAILNEYAVGEQ